jgi:putative SOS response-associated peptidase YedK
MCYDAETAARNALRYAIHRSGSQAERERLQRDYEKLWGKELFTYYHVGGFTHPKMLVFTDKDPLKPQAFNWGLIPSWVKEWEGPFGAKITRTKTLNARGETIFEKPAFRESAKSKRCVVYLDAFYEHHHIGKNTYPFRILMKDESPMALAGLWSEWVNKETSEVLSTFAIVTTVGNSTMAKIHNNPKAESGPRMPVILPQDLQDRWLDPKLSKEEVQALIKPFDESLIKFHTVGRLKGKNAVGNVPEVENEVRYAEVEWA